ncbi:cytochrome c [Fulvivirga sp. 1062]|uniref:Cytochrome c n=2 Tax=Fulvivirga sedimenti TaxID=2879465 RepID=A0A9X1HNW1_9BACT|nr:cytochrome c [Fulvivirga sedimenti]MCA6073634.1 cytochrome c [Fulvivirga sedimenti]
MTVKNYLHTAFAFFSGLAMVACGASGNDQGLEYAPNMYHSVPYEPLSQIKDKDAGNAAELLRSNDDGHGEYYNSNPLNTSEMTMRVPPANTVPRGKYIPYRIPKDSLALAARIVENPIEDSEIVLKQGKELYERFCDHCHGAKGLGAEEGSVGEVFAGVPSYTSAALKDVSGGHIFHVITNGKGRMGAHGSQISVEDRWKIVRYVQTLQKQ